MLTALALALAANAIAPIWLISLLEVKLMVEPLRVVMVPF